MATLQLVTARPSMITVQAPQSWLSQPYFVPVRLDASRSAQSSGVWGSSRYSIGSPWTVIFAIEARLARSERECEDQFHGAWANELLCRSRARRRGRGRTNHVR